MYSFKWQKSHDKTSQSQLSCCFASQLLSLKSNCAKTKKSGYCWNVGMLKMIIFLD